MGITMRILDNTIGSVVSSISYAVTNIFSGIGSVIGGVIGKKIRVPEKWETIKVDEEEKKFIFEGSLSEGYVIYYKGDEKADSSGRVSGTIGQYDLRSFPKEENSALYNLIYKLEGIHDYLKNRELATRIAKKIYADALSKVKK